MIVFAVLIFIVVSLKAFYFGFIIGEAVAYHKAGNIYRGLLK